jgi:uncharacterized protein YndB with AHSA1/START domain
MIQFETDGESKLTARIHLNASPERVYRAWTDPLDLIKWFRGSEEGHLDINTFDCQEGGSYDVTIVNGKGDRFNLVGSYKVLKPGQRIVMTWQWITGETQSHPTQVTIDLQPDQTGCVLTLQHERFGIATERDMHQSGWQPCLDNLVSYLQTI